MYTQTDYSKLIKFAKQHPELTRNQAYYEAKKVGIEAQKKGGLEALRIEFGLKEGEGRGKKIGELTSTNNYIPPIKISRKTGKRHYIILDKKADTHIIDARSPSVKTLQKNIRELYGDVGNDFLKISLKIDNDGYTKLNQFSLLIPYNEKEKFAVKKMGYEILKNLKSYYGNLAKKYSNKASYSDLKNSMLDKIKSINTDINKSRGLDKNKLEMLFAEKGIEINSFQILHINDVE